MVWRLLLDVEHDAGTSSSRRELKWGLALIAFALSLHIAVISVWAESSASRAQQLYRDALMSVMLITRIARDLDQQHILLDVHVLESDPAGMARIEHELNRASADLADAESAYTPLVELPGEGSVWREAQRLISRFETTKGGVLALSRENRDAEARGALTADFDEFSQLQRRVLELIALDRAGADAAMARIRILRRVTVIGMLATGIVVLAIVLILGRRAIRRIMSYEEQIVGYARMLEERNRDLDAFAGRLAHDLLSPVASLKLSVDLMSHPKGGGYASARDRLQRSVEHMTTMIEDLLAFARAETAAKSEPCDPAVVVAKVSDDFLVRFGGQATLHTRVEAAHVACREGLLRQVLWNLVENGVKYRRDDLDATITISGGVAAGCYELRVADNGTGVQPEDAQHIFEPLYRSDSARHVPGTGLGLSIVKRIVEASGGKISLQSQPGCGTTFLLRLPLAYKSPHVSEAA